MWRDTARDVTIGPFDAWVLLPFPLIPFTGYSMWSIYTFLIVALAFALLRISGLGVAGGLRFLRACIAGDERPAVPSWKRRHFA